MESSYSRHSRDAFLFGIRLLPISFARKFVPTGHPTSLGVPRCAKSQFGRGSEGLDSRCLSRSDKSAARLDRIHRRRLPESMSAPSEAFESLDRAREAHPQKISRHHCLAIRRFRTGGTSPVKRRGHVTGRDLALLLSHAHQARKRFTTSLVPRTWRRWRPTRAELALSSQF